MKFSVVMPLYNKAAYVTHAIQSVLNQSFTDFEVIVIDDGSSDGGADLVRAFHDPRIRVVQQANAGVSAARNRGIALAHGEWVALLDADDCHHPQYLETMLAVLQRYPEADMAASTYERVPDQAHQWPPAWVALNGPPEVEYITDLFGRWMKGPTFCTSAVCIRTSLLNQMRPCFPPGESQGEDLDLWFRLSERTPIPLIQTPLLAYRVDVEDSLTSNIQKLEMAPFLRRIRARALDGKLVPALRSSALQLVAQQQVTLARQALASHRRLLGLKFLLYGSRAISSLRWWATAAMMLLPGQFQNLPLCLSRKSTRPLLWKEKT